MKYRVTIRKSKHNHNVLLSEWVACRAITILIQIHPNIQRSHNIHTHNMIPSYNKSARALRAQPHTADCMFLSPSYIIITGGQLGAIRGAAYANTR